MNDEPLIHIDPLVLDNFLKIGWYRMGQRMFTTDYIEDGERQHRVVWIRYQLSIWNFHHQKLIRRNKHFRVSVCPAADSAECDRLFAAYRNYVTFNTSNSIFENMGGSFQFNAFNTQMTQIREGNKLVAAGYFDLGRDSAAGILNFYDPEYHKYSLGKYLIKIKTDFLKAGRFKWFYPGYISPTYKKFDYKVIDGEAIEMLERPANKWIPFDQQLLDSWA